MNRHILQVPAHLLQEALHLTVHVYVVCCKEILDRLGLIKYCLVCCNCFDRVIDDLVMFTHTFTYSIQVYFDIFRNC